MFFNPLIHPASLLAKDILGRIEKMQGGLNYSNNELLVLNYHSTPKKFILDFTGQVDFLRDHFHIIKPAELEDYYAGKLSSDKCCALFTFDDGLKNNLYAVKILEERGIKAFFFIVPGFVDAPAQKQFYLKNIRPVVNPRIDHEEEDTLAMSWDEIHDLAARGHSIGAHTLSHTLLAETSSLENSEKEIAGCKLRLEAGLQIRVNAFCSINDTLLSTGKKEKEIIEKNYAFHFTTLPGFNAIDQDRLFIKRRNVECHWPTGAFYYALGRSDLARWKTKIGLYENL